MVYHQQSIDAGEKTGWAVWKTTPNNSANEKPLYDYLTPEEWFWRCSMDYVSIGALCSKENIARNGKIDTLMVVINRTCFTGTNPIIKYIGPKPR